MTSATPIKFRARLVDPDGHWGMPGTVEIWADRLVMTSGGIDVVVRSSDVKAVAMRRGRWWEAFAPIVYIVGHSGRRRDLFCVPAWTKPLPLLGAMGWPVTVAGA